MTRIRNLHGRPVAARATASRARVAIALGLAGAVAFALTGCGSLLPKAEPPPSYYSLDPAGPAATPVEPAPAARTPGRTLVVSTPRAAAGYDSPRIVYIRDGQRIESFARSAWVDTPAHMLSPLMVAALTSAGWPGVVMPAPSAASADLALDTEVVRLHQDFAGAPSQVRFTLRAWLVDRRSRQVLASREFDEVVASPRDDAGGGVIAARQAVQQALGALARWSRDAAGG